MRHELTQTLWRHERGHSSYRHARVRNRLQQGTWRLKCCSDKIGQTKQNKMKARKTHPLCGQLGDMEQRLRAAAALQLDERTVVHQPHHARLVRAPHLQVIRMQGC